MEVGAALGGLSPQPRGSDVDSSREGRTELNCGTQLVSGSCSVRESPPWPQSGVKLTGSCLVAQRLQLYALTAKSQGLIPGLGTGILQDAKHSPQTPTNQPTNQKARRLASGILRAEEENSFPSCVGVASPGRRLGRMD